MKKKVVITGISSLIMQKLISWIDLSRYKVIGISREPSKLKLKGVEIVKGDIFDTTTYEDQLVDCYMIIHAAAVTHSFKKEAYYKTNLEATRELVNSANKYRIKKFVFISSNTAGPCSGAYGISKFLAEEYIQENFDRYTIIRPSEVYGGEGKEGIEKVISDVFEKPFVLCPLGVPTNFMPIHIEDAVKIIYLKAFKSIDNNTVEILTGQEEFTFFELIELAKSISGRNPRIIYIRKSIIFMIKRVVEKIPFNIGILPDQIDRLYCIKKKGNSVTEMKKLETYIKDMYSSR